MPPKRKAPAAKKAAPPLVDSEPQDELAAEAPAPKKRTTRPPPAAKAKLKKTAAAGKKKVTLEEVDEVETTDEEVGEVVVTKAVAVKKAAAAGRKVAAAGKKVAAGKKKNAPAAEIAETQVPTVASYSSESELEPAPVPAKKARTTTTTKKKKAVEIAETQMPVKDSEDEEEEEEEEEEEAAPTSTQVHSKKRGVGKGVVIKDRFKLEELRTTAAERALEEFRRNSEEAMKEADTLISHLRADLSAQTVLAAESRALKHRLSSKETEITKLHTRVAELTKAVATASKEQQVLQAKLSVQVPGSAVKPGRGPLVGIGGAAGADQQWVQRVKEELYGDLTNLMIVSVKKESESRLFECLQTGANGALHFKLAVREPSRRPRAPVEEDADDEYIFIPMLDEARDRFVISLLPDYLRNEISFSRDHAARFYQKINLVLMKPPVVEVDVEEVETDAEEEDEEEEEEGGGGGDVTVGDTTIGGEEEG